QHTRSKRDWSSDVCSSDLPENIVELEHEIDQIKKEKNKVVKKQRFEEAAALRDEEKQLVKKLDDAKSDWEEEIKHRRYPIDEERSEERRVGKEYRLRIERA